MSFKTLESYVPGEKTDKRKVQLEFWEEQQQLVNSVQPKFSAILIELFS